MRAALALLLCAGCSSSKTTTTTEPWLADAHIAVVGNGATNHDCRADICKHNENTDLTVWHGDIYLVHRTAESQMLGPNSSLDIYRYDGGTFTLSSAYRRRAIATSAIRISTSSATSCASRRWRGCRAR